MKFELKTYNRNIPIEKLLDDVRKVADILKKETVSVSEYNDKGIFHSTTLIKRFGSWNKVLDKAKLKRSMIFNATREDLFKNLERVWISLSRQPISSEMKRPLSDFSITPYLNMFGSWQEALKTFINYIDQAQSEYDKVENDLNPSAVSVDLKNNKTKRTKREISDRLRFKILLRDGFTCRKCGRSPLKKIGVELHVDHITPWSKGGETIPENLETKCKECNLGKGNAFKV
jgi:hypothetical protein